MNSFKIGECSKDICPLCGKFIKWGERVHYDILDGKIIHASCLHEAYLKMRAEDLRVYGFCQPNV